MFDPLRDELPASRSSPAAGDSDVKVERLLLTGLDHYFQGEHERAIDLWTRVLFLDRSHARARAYIERARAALAERMRESEELLHTGAEAFRDGKVGEARELLRSAVEHGGGRDEALTLLERLNRLETAAGRNEDAGQTRGDRHPRERQSVVRDGRVRRPVRVVPLVALFLALAAGLYAAASWDRVESLLVIARPVSAVTGPAVPRSSLIVPSRSDLIMSRAEQLLSQGRARETLRLLATVGPGDPRGGEADDLRATIQRTLLDDGEVGRTGASTTARPQ